MQYILYLDKLFNNYEVDMNRLLYLIVILLFFQDVGFSQGFYTRFRERKFSVMGGVGTSTYFGDVAVPGVRVDLTPAFELKTQYRFYKYTTARVSITNYTLAAADAVADEDYERAKRDHTFRANNFEFTAQILLYLLPLEGNYYKRPKFNAYGIAGGGFSTNNPKAKFEGSWYNINNVVHNSYQKIIVPVVPFGVGGYYKINPFFNIGIEAVYRKLFTDFVDGIGSESELDTSQFVLPEQEHIANSVAIGTHTDKKDGYFLLTVNFEYYISPLVFKNPARRSQRNMQRRRRSPMRYRK